MLGTGARGQVHGDRWPSSVWGVRLRGRGRPHVCPPRPHSPTGRMLVRRKGRSLPTPGPGSSGRGAVLAGSRALMAAGRAPTTGRSGLWAGGRRRLLGGPSVPGVPQWEGVCRAGDPEGAGQRGRRARPVLTVAPALLRPLLGQHWRRMPARTTLGPHGLQGAPRSPSGPRTVTPRSRVSGP